MTHLLESDDIPGVQNLEIDGSVICTFTDYKQIDLFPPAHTVHLRYFFTSVQLCVFLGPFRTIPAA